MLPLGDPAPRPAAPELRGADPVEMLASWIGETAGGVDDLKPRLLRLPDGHLLPLDIARWSGPVDDADRTLLARAAGAVLDVGCGPGRLTAELHSRGMDVLGLELVPELPVLARAAGAPLVVGDVFGDVPRTGEWDSVLLADGNVGIGGDAAVMLRRAAELVSPAGQVLVELTPGAEQPPGPVRLEGLGSSSTWFRWALLGRAALPTVSAAAGLTVLETWTAHGRLFAALTPV